jgi:hypothetical protein
LALHCLWHQSEGIRAANSSPDVWLLMLVAALIF